LNSKIFYSSLIFVIKTVPEPSVELNWVNSGFAGKIIV